jgi:hypothetical protein
LKLRFSDIWTLLDTVRDSPKYARLACIKGKKEEKEEEEEGEEEESRGVAINVDWLLETFI